MLDMKMVVLFEVNACGPTPELAVDDLADVLEGITSAPASPTTSCRCSRSCTCSARRPLRQVVRAPLHAKMTFNGMVPTSGV